MTNEIGTHLSLAGYSDDNVRVKYIQLHEACLGVLPTMTIGFSVGYDELPSDGEDISMTLTLSEKSEIELEGTINSRSFKDNYMYLYITLAPKDFYFDFHSASFDSAADCIDKLYWSELVGSTKNTSSVVLNQVHESDYKVLNRTLLALPAPVIFSYRLVDLKLTNMASIKTDFDETKEKKSFSVREEGNKLVYKRQGVSEIELSEDLALISTLTYDKFIVQAKPEVAELINNMYENKKYFDSLTQFVDVLCSYYPPYSVGDIIKQNIDEIDAVDFLVLDKQTIIDDDVKVKLILAAL